MSEFERLLLVLGVLALWSTVGLLATFYIGSKLRRIRRRTTKLVELIDELADKLDPGGKSSRE